MLAAPPFPCTGFGGAVCVCGMGWLVGLRLWGARRPPCAPGWLAKECAVGWGTDALPQRLAGLRALRTGFDGFILDAWRMAARDYFLSYNA